MAESQRSLWVKIIKQEIPNGLTWTTQKVKIKGMEDGGFLVVVVKLTSIMLNDLDFVFSVALVRASMEEAWKRLRGVVLAPLPE